MPSETIFPDQIDWDAPGKRHYSVAFHLDSSWGYSLVPLTVINGSREIVNENMPGVAVFGGTHGNEWEGQIAVKRLCSELNPEQIAGRVILMPQLSASACSANTRLSPLDNVNMNRAFPGKARGSISYRIAHFVKASVFPLVRVVADLHSGGVEGGFALCTSIHSVPDTLQFSEMLKAAKLFDTPFVFLYSSQMASGLLTDEAEAEGKIAVGGEFGFGETVSRRGVRHAFEGMMNLMRRYGHLPGDVQRIDTERDGVPRVVSALDLGAYVPALRDGIWEPAVDLGDSVQKGDAIGYLHDFAEISHSPMKVQADRDGVVVMMHAPASCLRGVTLFVIAEEVPSDG